MYGLNYKKSGLKKHPHRLVTSKSNVKILEEPVSQTKNGITLELTSVTATDSKL